MNKLLTLIIFILINNPTDDSNIDKLFEEKMVTLSKQIIYALPRRNNSLIAIYPFDDNGSIQSELSRYMTSYLSKKIESNLTEMVKILPSDDLMQFINSQEFGSRSPMDVNFRKELAKKFGVTNIVIGTIISSLESCKLIITMFDISSNRMVFTKDIDLPLTSQLERIIILNKKENLKEEIKIQDKSSRKEIKEDISTNEKAQVFIKEADNLISQKKYEYALKYLKKAEEFDKDNPKLLKKIGDIYRFMKDKENSETYYNKSIKLDPYNTETYLALGSLYKDNEDYNKAEEIYNNLLKKDPNNPKLHHSLGELYTVMSKYEKAIASFKKNIELDPNCASAYNNIGFLYNKMGNLDSAIASYNKAIKINPNYSTAYNNLGVIYLNKNRYEDAIKEFIKALKIDPNYISAHYNLALAYEHVDIDKAIREWEIYLDIISSNPDYSKDVVEIQNRIKLLKGEPVGERKKNFFEWLKRDK